MSEIVAHCRNFSNFVKIFLTMKICHVLWQLEFGGIETMVVNIVNEQVALGNKVDIIIINDMIEPVLLEKISANAGVHRLGRKQGSHSPFPIISLNVMLYRLHPDIVHFHAVDIQRFVWKRLIGVWCTTHHTMCVSVLHRFFPNNKHIFAISEQVRDDIKSKLDIDSAVVNNGICASDFVRKQSIRRDSDTPFKLVQVGRILLSVKGQDILVRAVAALRAKDVDVTLDFIGDGPDMDELRRLIRDLSLDDCVNVLGSRMPEYIESHLCEYDMLVQPSRIEGFGLTVAEAMAAGIPVAVASLPALAGVVDGGKCGYIFKADDVEDCVRVLKQATNADNSDMVERACRRVYEQYDVSVTARNYVNEYSKLLKQ